jgi:hypothetical protein
MAISISFNPRMAKAKNLKNKHAEEPRKFADGDTVLINRPHLWSGCSGVVVGFADGLHRVKVTARPDATTQGFFHTDVPGSQLEDYL